MQIINKLLLATTAVSTICLTGCVVEPYPRRVVVAPAPVVVAGPEVVVTEAPPPPQTEVVVASPGVGFVWAPGAWVWHGRWVWEGGRWMRPPHRGARWVPHHYEFRGGRHVFIEGGWR